MSSSATTNENSTFLSFVPKDDIDLSGYKEAIDYALNTDKIRNIAISGPYGSGKSSIVESYEKANPDKKIIHISLARFNDISCEDSDEVKADDTPAPSAENSDSSNKDAATASSISDEAMVNLLEGKILNQLIHLISPDVVLNSGFRINSNDKKISFQYPVLFLCIFTFFAIYAAKFSSWCSYIESIQHPEIASFLNFSTSTTFRLFAIVLCILASAYTLYKGLDYIFNEKRYKNRISKLNINGSGMELFEEQSDSFFDKYLDDIIYLLEHSRVEAIIFEDLDRYDTTKIFEKLREISYLLYQRKIGAERCNKPAEDSASESKATACSISYPKFIYLVKDDIFTSSDRIKFFDFIIPTVPVVTAYNSNDKLIETFEKIGKTPEFNKRFLFDISLYISDMRLVYNVANEYRIFRARLKESSHLDKTIKYIPEKLLAMIIYKNLFPQDFTALQHGHGYLFSRFKMKSALIPKIILDLNNQISDLNKQAKEIENEHLNNIDELNALYYPLNENIYKIDNQIVEGLDRVTLVKKLLKCTNNSSVLYTNGAHYSLPFSRLDDKRVHMEENPEYVRRKNLLARKSYNEKLSLISESQELKLEKAKLCALPLKEILNMSDDSDAFFKCEGDFEDKLESFDSIISCRELDLIKYFLKNGYISEDYHMYLSYYYTNSLSVTDKQFLLDLANGKKVEADYILDSPKNVLERLETSDFRNPLLLNYYLLEYMVSVSAPQLSTWLDTIDAQINNNGLYSNAYAFIQSAWLNTENKDLFVPAICRLKPHWLQNWKENGLADYEVFNQFVEDALVYLNYSMLKTINSHNWLTLYLSDNGVNYCRISLYSKNDQHKIISSMFHLEVKLKSIPYDDKWRDFAKALFASNIYELNAENLSCWLTNFSSADFSQISSSVYTYFITNDDLLFKRINQEPDNFMAAMFKICDTKVTDTVKAVQSLLNEFPCSISNKIKYIENLETVLPDIKSISDTSFWPELLSCHCIEFRWENLMEYYKVFCLESGILDNSFVDFLNNSESVPLKSRGKLEKEFGKDAFQKFVDSIVKCSSISEDRYNQILKNLHYVYETFSITGLSEYMVKALAGTHTIAMNKGNYDFIYSNYHAYLCDFINSNQAGFLTLLENKYITFEQQDITSLLECANIKADTKLSALSFYQNSVLLTNHKYSDSITAEIIRQHLDRNDIEYCVRNFDNFGKLSQTAFLEYANKNVSTVLNTAIAIQFIPTALYAASMPLISEHTALRLRRFISDKNFELVCTGNKNPSFEDTPDTKKILSYFEEIGWISSFKRTADGKIKAYSKRNSLAHV